MRVEPICGLSREQKGGSVETIRGRPQREGPTFLKCFSRFASTELQALSK